MLKVTGQVMNATELHADGKQLRFVKLTEQAVPAPNGGRAQAPERGIDFQQVAAQAD